MKIPFFSFKGMHPDCKEGLSQVFDHFYDSNWYVLGDMVKDFETRYARFSGVNHCVGVGNGLDALHLSLLALEIGEGDEVIVPSNTYIATWLAISYAGATIVPVEPDDRTFNLNPELIERAITDRTKVIMPVHLYGQACEMGPIMDIATRHDLFVVEDNAQSQGCTHNGRMTGSFGHINGVSFYPGKNLGALGDAGAITTNSAFLAEKIRTLRNYGSEKKYYNERIGYNSRLDELQAGILSYKLPWLTEWNEERKKVAMWYDAMLSSHPDLRCPIIAEGSESVYHQYVICTDLRDELQAHLHHKGIGTLIHYPVPPHLQIAYSDLGFTRGDFPIAEEIADTVLSLPIYPGLDEEDIHYISREIIAFMGNA